jgi:hypothetical protein
MNKYIGFYELKSINLPAVPWKKFTADTVLDGNLLWTVRVALEKGNDLGLPRAVGVTADEAVRKGVSFLGKYGDNGMVIYYPYFIAEKSGVLDINNRRTVIEAVEKDLWNLVTYGKKNVSIIIPDEKTEQMKKHLANDGSHTDEKPYAGGIEIIGDDAFLSREEIWELARSASIIRGRFRDELNEGGTILAEWSYAYNTDTSHRPLGLKHLVFYELRGI